ncbi:MAG: helix-turn-helix domain-containing protein [Methylocystis sp.]
MSASSNTSVETPLAYQVNQFCRRCGISRATFYKYVKLSKIRVVKIGGRTLVPAAEVERLLSGEAA